MIDYNCLFNKKVLISIHYSFISILNNYTIEDIINNKIAYRVTKYYTNDILECYKIISNTYRKTFSTNLSYFDKIMIMCKVLKSNAIIWSTESKQDTLNDLFIFNFAINMLHYIAVYINQEEVYFDASLIDLDNYKDNFLNALSNNDFDTIRNILKQIILDYGQYIFKTNKKKKIKNRFKDNELYLEKPDYGKLLQLRELKKKLPSGSSNLSRNCNYSAIDSFFE